MKKQLTTEEGNKMIAEFMDADRDYIKDSPAYGEYHTSWDWLMPVVESIESTGAHFSIHNTSCSISMPGQATITETEGSKIQFVFDACVSFIQWYSLQPKL